MISFKQYTETNKSFIIVSVVIITFLCILTLISSLVYYKLETNDLIRKLKNKEQEYKAALLEINTCQADLLTGQFAKTKSLLATLANADTTNLDNLALAFVVSSIRHDLEIETLLAIAKVESNFNNKARSSTDDFGMMQINRLWSGSQAWDFLLQDNLVNIAVSARILSHYKKMHPNDYLWRYNGSRAYLNKLLKVRESIIDQQREL